MFCPEPMVSFRSGRKFSSYLVRTKLYPLQRTVCPFKCYKSSYQVCLNVYLKTLLLVLWLSRLNHKFITAVINVWFIYFHFFCLRPEIPFLLYMVQKIKISSLSWNLILGLIRIWKIQWWCLIFLFLTKNIIFGKIWSKNSKLFVQSEIWYLDQFEYAEFNGGVYYICFRLEIPSLVKFSLKNQSYQFKLKFGT